MKLLSIDVGIKNLAYCLFENQKVIEWDVVNLCGNINSCQECGKDATLHSNNIFFCRKCAKKSKLIIPPKGLYKQKIADLKQFMNKYKLKFDKKDKRDDLLREIKKKFFEPAVQKKADSASLVSMSIVMRDYFSRAIFSDVDIVLIENQIGPLANRMKAIQGMLTQVFVNMHIEKIEYISASNKLKHLEKKLTYNERKKESIKITRNAISKTKWNTFFEQHKKKDDLADSYLQGIWFIKNKI